MTKTTSAIDFFSSVTAPRAGAQEVALKTNLFYDATLTANIGAEVAVAPRWSIDLSGNLNAWTVGSDKRWKHWMIQPEARYWFCEAIGGHFVGAHLLGGQYNFIGGGDTVNPLGNGNCNCDCSCDPSNDNCNCRCSANTTCKPTSKDQKGAGFTGFPF